MGAARCVSRYPWLSPWAAERIALKTRRADVLRERAARLLDGDALVDAAVAAAMKQPELPLNDPAFTVLGTPFDVKWALSDLWRRWHSHVSRGRAMPSAHGGLVYFVMDSRLGGKRKGREQLWRRSAQLLQQWTDAALAEFARAGTQVSYYRTAHQMLDLGERLDQELMGNRWGGLAPETAGVTLDVVSGWLDDQEQNWQVANILQARRAVSDLLQLDQVRRQQEDGESDDGTVIQLKPKG